MTYVTYGHVVRDHNVFDRAVGRAIWPLQWLVVHSLDAAANVWNRYAALVHVQEDNDKLRHDNARLVAALAAADERAHENRRLRALLGLRERAPDLDMVLAQIIAVSPSPLFRSLRVDRGYADGIEVGAAVLSTAGVVGRIAATGAHFAEVILLVDANSSTDVLVQRTRARARVRGQGGDDGFVLEAQYLARTADVEPGDVLITSGLSRVFPKGLLAGRVVTTERRAFGLYQRATVQPSVDFGRLEAVMVVRSGDVQGASMELPAASTAPLDQER